MGAPELVPVPLTGYDPVDDPSLIARAEAFRTRMASRRTVRDFSDRPVPRAVIETCLTVAGTAPSGANLQPWHFAVIGSADLKRRIREAAEAEERAFYEGRAGDEWLEVLRPLGTDWRKPFLEIAPWLICVFGERRTRGPDGVVRKAYYVPESVSIASGFLLAALHHAGLATLTHTPSPMGFLNAICGRPASEKPYLLVVVGHPAEGATVPLYASAKKPLGEITSFL